MDVLVMDVSMSWFNQEQERQRAKAEGKPPPVKNVSTETLQAMLDRVKNK